jgi:hypothetical protein
MCAACLWSDKVMERRPLEILREGRAVLDPVLSARGFTLREGPAGSSSGGPFATGTFVNGNRSLEIHYHFGTTSVGHKSYMRAVVGKDGGNRYPGFSDDPISGFENLAYDLENFAAAFLNGDSKEFARCATAAEEWKKTPGFARLP